MAGEVATLAAEATPYAAALGAYGAAVLAKVRDDLADATIGAGRRVLQRIFGHREDGGELPVVLAELIENPGDEDYLGALRLAIRKALEADARLQADVRQIIGEARPNATVSQSVTAGRDAYVAGRDMTITRDAKYAVEAHDAQGLQIGDHNAQRNIFRGNQPD
jgi:hypothetical protein